MASSDGIQSEDGDVTDPMGVVVARVKVLEMIGWMGCYNLSQVKNMHRTKPFEIISVQFRISRESAKYFLIRVQKSFKTEKPPHQLILEFMNGQNFGSLPKPYQVATMMNESGVWAHRLNPEPPGLVDEEDVYGES